MNEVKLPKKSQSFWHLTGEVKKYPKLNSDLSVDVAVIGGGIAGILSAYEISQRGKSVALFEARELLYGTTGFTTSKLSAQHNVLYHELIERYGIKKARQYYDANTKAIEIIKELAEKHHIECGLKEQDAYVYTQLKSNVQALERSKGL